MKIYKILLLASIAIIGCVSKDKIKEAESFLPGTYVRYSEHEFGKEYDTLVISLQNADAREYSIVRKWRYERVIDGKTIAPEYSQKQKAAIYNPEESVLREASGDYYSVDPKEKVLYRGKLKYRKL